MTWIIPAKLRSHFAAESEDLTLRGQPSPEAELWVTLNGKAAQRPCSWKGWRQRTWSQRLFGAAIWRNWTPPHFEDWIGFLPDSLASRTRLPGSVEGFPMSVQSGPLQEPSLSKWGPDSCSWRTSPDLFQSCSPEFSGTWPKWGSMRNGCVYERSMLERATGGSDCSSWPTPSASLPQDGEDPETWFARREELKKKGNSGNGAGVPLAIAAKSWPTPAARDEKSGDASAATLERNARPLNEVVKAWKTPNARDGENGIALRGEDHIWGYRGLDEHVVAFHQAHPSSINGPKSSKPAQTSLQLSPRFVEWMMGFPIGWTEFKGSGKSGCEPLETLSFQHKEPQPCESCSGGSNDA